MAPKNKAGVIGATDQVLKRIVSAGEYAKHFRVSPATVTTWLDDGMPCVKRGKTRGGVLIDHLEADPWVATRRGAAKANSARTSVASEQAERLRMSNAKERRELIAVNEVRQLFHEGAAVLVQACEAMPQRVSSDEQVQIKVADECRSLRQAFADRFEAFAARDDSR